MESRDPEIVFMHCFVQSTLCKVRVLFYEVGSSTSHDKQLHMLYRSVFLPHPQLIVQGLD